MASQDPSSSHTVSGLNYLSDTSELSKFKSMSQLLLVLHGKLRAITTPLTYEQLQKNDSVRVYILCNILILGQCKGPETDCRSITA